MKHFPKSLALLALVATPASAAWTAIDTFESYASGSDLNGQGSWTANGDTTVAADPTNAGNQALNSARPLPW